MTLFITTCFLSPQQLQVAISTPLLAQSSAISKYAHLSVLVFSRTRRHQSSTVPVLGTQKYDRVRPKWLARIGDELGIPQCTAPWPAAAAKAGGTYVQV